MDEFIIAQIVPTGVGAEIGGYVGDATPATNILASIADKVIAHPNVVNAVTMEMARENVLYAEGYTIDRLFRGEIALREVRANKIGVVLDCGSEDVESTDMAINTIDAVRTVKGVDVIEVLRTERPVGGRAVRTRSGAFVGEIKDPETYLKPAGRLVKKGADAIAVSTVIKIDPKDLQEYFKGKCPNPYGGTEAIISHSVTRKYGIPCAHAPLLTKKEMFSEMFSGIVDARAGAEAISPAYLGCVLEGLHKAPRIVERKKAETGDITREHLSAVVLPASCMGGVPALAAEKYGIQIIAVEENRTVLDVTAAKLGLKNVITVKNYLEAAGVVAAMKEGIDPKAARRPIRKSL